jgi:hypothetical protein
MDHHDGDCGDDDDHPLIFADILSIIEFFLKKIVGGATLGREHGPSM